MTRTSLWSQTRCLGLRAGGSEVDAIEQDPSRVGAAGLPMNKFCSSAISISLSISHWSEFLTPPLSFQSPAWTANLDDVPNPPGGTLANGTGCVTRMVSITPSISTDMFPLTWSILPTDSITNNIATFPYGAGDGNGMYLSTQYGTYGLPSGGNIGITITG